MTYQKCSRAHVLLPTPPACVFYGSFDKGFHRCYVSTRSFYLVHDIACRLEPGHIAARTLDPSIMVFGKLKRVAHIVRLHVAFTLSIQIPAQGYYSGVCIAAYGNLRILSLRSCSLRDDHDDEGSISHPVGFRETLQLHSRAFRAQEGNLKNVRENYVNLGIGCYR